MDKLAEINLDPHFLDSSLFMRQKKIIIGVKSVSSTSLPVISRVPLLRDQLDLHRWNYKTKCPTFQWHYNIMLLYTDDLLLYCAIIDLRDQYSAGYKFVT